MQFKMKDLAAIRDGSVSLAFRRWQRPTAKTGGTQLTAMGQLGIDSVTAVSLSSLTESDASKAGFASLKLLKDELAKRKIGKLYRIELGKLVVDPRIELRSSRPTAEELLQLRVKLKRMDKRAGPGRTGLCQCCN